ncbi:hypothetical protein HID58_086718, partial [Brassica napus]
PLTLVSPSIYLSWRTNVWLSPVNGRYPTTTTHLRFSCPEVIVGINVTKIAPHIIHCTTGNAFDHTLLISGMYTNIHRPHVQLTGYIQHRRTSSQLSEWTPAYASTRTPPPDDIQFTPTSPVTPQVSETRPHFQSA